MRGRRQEGCPSRVFPPRTVHRTVRVYLWGSWFMRVLTIILALTVSCTADVAPEPLVGGSSPGGDAVASGSMPDPPGVDHTICGQGMMIEAGDAAIEIPIECNEEYLDKGDPPPDAVREEEMWDVYVTAPRVRSATN